ncbi:pentapeptide repeat-containing protein [Streptomyces sp. NPDC003388]
MNTPSPPSWPYCGRGADPATDPVGCTGVHVPGESACLAHLGDAERTTYLSGLTPGNDIDHRGTPITKQLLNGLLNALRDPSTGNTHLGNARFDGAQFSSGAGFGRAQFSGDANFDKAQFSGHAGFVRAQFCGRAGFDGVQFSGHAGFVGAQFHGEAGFVRAQFNGDAEFGGAQFSGHAGFPRAQFNGVAGFGGVQFNDDALFDGAQFSSRAWFGGAQFSGYAGFDGVQFSGAAEFGRAQFSGDARFEGARFEGVSVIGPLVCGGMVMLSGAVFGLPVTLEIASREVVAERTRWESTATIRLRHATVDLSHAVLSAPVAVTAAATPFTKPDGSALGEQALTGSADVRIASVQGVDAAHLVLTDTDLSDCLFSGAFHLDQIRLEGRTTFAPTPTGWHRHHLWPARWTRRRTLAEEHHWRAQTASQPALSPGTCVSPRQWRPGPHHPDPARTPDPEDVAALYRQLRKAFEDAKNEPGAADFYYGECEMRRHDTNSTPKGERRLLRGYWLLSGYGLRASRAFTWLIAAMSLTVLLLMGLGLPTHDPDPGTTGTLHGSKVSLHTSTPDPSLRGSWSERLTGARAEKATRVAINSVVFRSSGQNLTTAGTYLEMTSRLLEPTLLTLGALAIRGRIKR